MEKLIALLGITQQAEAQTLHQQLDAAADEGEVQQLFYQKLTDVLAEPDPAAFSQQALDDRFEQWLSLASQFARLDRLPPALRQRIFDKLDQAATTRRFTFDQEWLYVRVLMPYRDHRNAVETARQEGYMQGLVQAMVKNALAAGVDSCVIMQHIKITEAKLTELSKNLTVR